MQAPTLRGFDFDGAPLDTAATGRPKMLVFLAHWCPHCNREIPVLQSWAAAGGVPAGLDIVGVSTAVDPQRDNYPPSKWVDDKAWTWPVLADSAASDAAAAYGVAAFPTFVIVGADGTVKVRSSGELPVADLDAIVRQAIDS
jgi:thiol-disulfide isomerase/thioredoxin